jgi:hypothetical protein
MEQRSSDASKKEQTMDVVQSRKTKYLVIGIALLLIVGTTAHFALNNQAPAAQAPSVMPSQVARAAQKAGAPTLDDLAKTLQDAYRAKDIDGVLALFYMAGVDDATKASLIKNIQADFQNTLPSVELVEPAAKNLYQYTQGGITYGVNLPVIKEAKLKFAKNASGITSTSFYVGIHNGTYYLVTAAPVSSAKATGASDAATIDFAQKAVMRALNFAQGDLARLMAAHNDFTPRGWSLYMKWMAGFLDPKGAPLFSSAFTPSGTAAVIGTQNGVAHLSIPGTLKQTQNTSSTTYRVKVDLYAGGQPIKMEKLEVITCGGASTHPAPCN